MTHRIDQPAAYILLALLCATGLLLSSRKVTASGYHDGYQSDGYTYYGNYWWRGYQAYTRSYYYPQAYYSYGHYYQPPGHYQYYYSHTYTPTYTAPAATPQVTAQVPKTDWRSTLLEAALAKDKVEGELRKGALEQRYFMEAVKQLGLEQSRVWQGYGQPVPYGGYAPGYYTPQPTGTVYGYTYNSVAQAYGDIDRMQLFQGANRLAENAQKLGAQATQDFSQLVAQEGSNAAKVAEIFAKGKVVQDYLKALEGNSTRIEVKGQGWKVEQGGAGTVPTTPAQPQNAPQMPPAQDPVLSLLYTAYGVPVGNPGQLLKAHLKKDCAACHDKGPDNPASKRRDSFLVSDWDRYPQSAKQAAYERVTTKDDDERMPRLKGGGVAPRVPPELAKLYTLY